LIYPLAAKLLDLDVREPRADVRIFEYSFVLQRLLGLPKGKVLDVGCASGINFLAPTLATLGWQVYGIDGRKFRLNYPGFHFTLGEITCMPFPDNEFDVVYAVSTLEHMGPGGEGGIYGVSNADADFKAVAEISRVLKPGGILLVTVPFGRPRVIKKWQRIYDEPRLLDLFNRWQIQQRLCFIRDKTEGRVVTFNELSPNADFDINEATALWEVVREHSRGQEEISSATSSISDMI
jgi:SAM-dependent methyltransferase